MSEKQVEVEGAGPETFTGAASTVKVLKVKPAGPTAAELLLQAAELLEAQQGPRANKYYRNLAVVTRQLAARAA